MGRQGAAVLRQAGRQHCAAGREGPCSARGRTARDDRRASCCCSSPSRSCAERWPISCAGARRPSAASANAKCAFRGAVQRRPLTEGRRGAGSGLGRGRRTP